MRNTKLERVEGRWRLSYPLYVELGSTMNTCSHELVVMLEKSLKRLLFKQALLHCTDEFRHFRQVLRCSR